MAVQFRDVIRPSLRSFYRQPGSVLRQLHRRKTAEPVMNRNFDEPRNFLAAEKKNNFVRSWARSLLWIFPCAGGGWHPVLQPL